MAIQPDRTRLASLLPPDVDRPLFSFQRQSILAGRPHAVFVIAIEVVVVGALELVRHYVDVGESRPRPVVPLQLDVDALEAVSYQLLFIPDLSHASKLPATDPQAHDHDLQLEY